MRQVSSLRDELRNRPQQKVPERAQAKKRPARSTSAPKFNPGRPNSGPNRPAELRELPASTPA
eukprot:4396190-Amphidinium_carterae.1